MPGTRPPDEEARYQRDSLTVLSDGLVRLLGDAQVPRKMRPQVAGRIIDLLDVELPVANRYVTSALRPRIVAALRYLEYRKAHHRAEAQAVANELRALVAAVRAQEAVSPATLRAVAAAERVLEVVDAPPGGDDTVAEVEGQSPRVRARLRMAQQPARSPRGVRPRATGSAPGGGHSPPPTSRRPGALPDTTTPAEAPRGHAVTDPTDPSVDVQEPG